MSSFSARGLDKSSILQACTMQFRDKAPVEGFLEFMRWRTRGDAARAIGIRVAYIVHQIWQARNNLVFEARRFLVRLIMERAP